MDPRAQSPGIFVWKTAQCPSPAQGRGALRAIYLCVRLGASRKASRGFFVGPVSCRPIWLHNRVLPLILHVNPARDEQMSIDAEAIADRRRLRRKLSFWRVLGFSGLIAAVAAIGYAAADRMGYGGIQNQIARISVDGVITGNQRLADLMQRVGDSGSVSGVVISINSPGGTTTGSEELFRNIRRLPPTTSLPARRRSWAPSACYSSIPTCRGSWARLA
jgi:hypothetical protein